MRRGFESLMVGRLLAGRYEVRAPIARGGMSIVFRALDRTLGREVAVKVVSLAGAASESALPVARERFRREAASAARIQHANVVQIFDYGTDPELELDFIVMELLRGRDLKETLAAGPLPEDEALRVVRDAARGIAAGHRAGIVHRDVKPANVFLAGEEGRVEAVKVLDFGIAKGMDDTDGGLTLLGASPHSPAYASPEQLDPRMPLTPASDVYQLGLVAYEALTGQRAHTAEERDDVRRGIPVPLAETEAWRSVPPRVRDAVERALRPVPGERHATAAEFAEALAGEEHAPSPPVEPDPDETALAPPPPPPRPAADDAALLAAQAGVPVAPPPTGARPTARSVPRAPVLWIVPLLLVLAAAVWAARRGGGDPEPAAAVAADTAALAALDDEFLRMQGEVGSGEAPVPEAPPADADAPPPTVRDPGAAAQIEAAVHDLNEAWVAGDISRHVGHYASRVDYYNSRRLPVSGVRRDRTRDLRRYDDRRIGIHDVQVVFLAEDRARALVDKEWYFEGDGRERRGRGMQEYVFARDDDDGRWYVVSEQLLTTSEARSGAEDEG